MEGKEEAKKKGGKRKGRHIDRRKEEGEILEKGGREEGREGERNRAEGREEEREQEVRKSVGDRFSSC